MVAVSPLRAGKKQPNDLDHPDKTCTKEGRTKRRETFQPAPIPLLDLTRKYRSIEAELHRQWNLTFESMRLLNGRNLAAFEEEFAAYCNVRHAVGVASGTDAAGPPMDRRRRRRGCRGWPWSMVHATTGGPA